MYIIFNKLVFFINKLKILIIISNYNKYFSNLFLYNFLNRLILIGIFRNNIIIINIKGSLEITYFLNIFFIKKIFDIYVLLGFIFKNKTFHFEILCLNIFFSLFKFSFNLNIPFINSLVLFNNNYNFLSKIIRINDLNLKIFFKFLNFLYFNKNYLF